MKSTQLLNALLLGALVFTPTLVSAQTEASAGGSTDTTISSDGTSAAATTNTEVATQGVVSPRDAASGLPTGKRQHAPVVIKNEISARTASGTKPLPKDMEKRLEDRDAMHTKLQGSASGSRPNMDEKRAEMMERRSEILKRNAMRMIAHMNAAIGRLSKLADRVDSRIVKMKEHGADTTKAEAHIATTRTKIAEASAAVKLAEDSIAAALANADTTASSTTPSDPGKMVREALNKAKEAVFAAHKALVEAIKSLKGIRIDTVATTTVQTGSGTTTTP